MDENTIETKTYVGMPLKDNSTNLINPVEESSNVLEELFYYLLRRRAHVHGIRQVPNSNSLEIAFKTNFFLEKDTIFILTVKIEDLKKYD